MAKRVTASSTVLHAEVPADGFLLTRTNEFIRGEWVVPATESLVMSSCFYGQACAVESCKLRHFATLSFARFAKRQDGAFLCLPAGLKKNSSSSSSSKPAKQPEPEKASDVKNLKKEPLPPPPGLLMVPQENVIAFCVQMLKLDGEVNIAQAELDVAEKTLEDQSKLVDCLRNKLLDLTEKTMALQREWTEMQLGTHALETAE